MGFKERAEALPVLYVLGALLSGFLAGLGTYEGILRIAKLETEQKGSYVTKGRSPKRICTSIRTDLSFRRDQEGP
jgi:hypothetical protein